MHDLRSINFELSKNVHPKFLIILTAELNNTILKYPPFFFLTMLTMLLLKINKRKEASICLAFIIRTTFKLNKELMRENSFIEKSEIINSGE